MTSTFNPYKDTLNMPFFIAEIGINHNGDMSLTKQLIDMAHDAGCQAIKFHAHFLPIRAKFHLSCNLFESSISSFHAHIFY